MSPAPEPGASATAEDALASAHDAPAQPGPNVLLIDTRALTYQEALDLVRDAYRVNEHGNPRVHYCPGPVVWTQEQDGGWRWQWDAEMLRAFAAGLPDNALLPTWQICSRPGKPVEAREVGTLLFPDGTEQQQMTAASQAVTAANRHTRNTVGHRAPFIKTYPGRQSGAGRARYAATRPVAAILLSALRETGSFQRPSVLHPCMLAPDGGETGSTRLDRT